MTAFPSNKIYLDHNATSPIRPEALDAVNVALAAGGNPSSVHAAGRAARARVEDARAAVATLVSAQADDAVVFTSGGTEANALAIHSAAASGRFSRLIVGATEHEAVMQSARASGLPVEVWPVDRQGVADLDWLSDRLSRWSAGAGRPFVALMLANNETGMIQPVAETAALAHAHGGWLHVDAVQAAGKIAVDMQALGADTMALSAHKLGGPQGVGALVHDERATLSPLLHGGGQERGLRAGTENVAGIVGFAAAARAAQNDLAATFPVIPAEAKRRAGTQGMRAPLLGPGSSLRAVRDDKGEGQAAWRNAAAERLKAAGAVVIGEGAPRLPNTLCIAVEGWTSALQVMALDLDGVMVSAGAACSSGKVKPSGVLAAMGLDTLAGGSIRASGGWSTSAADWDRFADVWLAAHARQAARAGRVKEFA